MVNWTGPAFALVRPGRQALAQGVLALFVARQDFPRASNHIAGQARQARDLDAVALVGASRLDLPQEDDVGSRFLHRDVIIAHAGQKVGQLGKLVIVGGEERLGPSVRLQVLDHGPGDGQAVEGGRAASHLVQQHQAARRGGVEDGGRLRHLHHERGAAPRQVIGSADAGKDAVENGKLGARGGHKAPHLRHQGDQRRLAQVS